MIIYIGKKLSITTCNKMSESRMGKKNPMFGKRGENCPHFGKKHNEETKKKMRLALIGNTRASGKHWHWDKNKEVIQ